MFPESGRETGEILRGCLPEDLGDLYQLGDGKKKRTSFAQRLGKALSERKDRRYGIDGIHVSRAGEDTHKKVKAWQVMRDAGYAGYAGLVSADLEIDAKKDFPNSFPNPLPGTPHDPATPQIPLDEERAAIMEFDGGLSRDEAESQAKKGENS